MTRTPLAKLTSLSTVDLIAEYNAAHSDACAKRFNENGPTRLQTRINTIVDLLDARADAHDNDALAWFGQK